MTEPHDYDPTEPPPPPPPPYGRAPGYGAPPNVGAGYTHQSCMSCGYNLTGLQPGGVCPECGTQLPPPYVYGQYQPTSGLAITSMILGICAIPACLFYGLPAVVLGIAGLVVGRMAKKQIAGGYYADASRGMAKAGFICSLVGLILGILYMLFFIVFIIIMVNTAPPSSNSPYYQNNPSFPQQWQGTPGGSAVGASPGNPYAPTVQPGTVITGPHGLDANGRPALPAGSEYGPDGRVRPALPGSLEYGPGGRIQPAGPTVPSPHAPQPYTPSTPSPF